MNPIIGARVDGFWLRLKQRKLVQWSAVDIAGSFALIQVRDVAAQRFGWPDRVEKLVILALLLAIGGCGLWVHARAPAGRPDGAQRYPGSSRREIRETLLRVPLLAATNPRMPPPKRRDPVYT